ncbi:MAG TPA: FAD-dependent thymidylate synthase [Candidatus Aminicenantes bacterium]|nr:FAD-dependent thymidylate synthase [Candidatus Aminicenantes bacterium]
MQNNIDIRLAGFNVDADLLRSLEPESSQNLTPETISAAYARISRSAASIDELRLQARQEVTRARQSNSRIIFDMGHHSIAEHAVFNFDIMGISRLAMEEIETMRLVSFTEKSQRYVTLLKDTLIPGELLVSPLKAEFENITSRQNRFYSDALEIIDSYLANQATKSGLDKASSRQLRNLAKEDARYALPLATRGQLGMTINARNLEYLLRRTALSRLEEVRNVGQRLFRLVQPVAPSLILFSEPSAFDRKLARGHCLPPELKPAGGHPSPAPYSLIEAPQNGDDIVLTALLARVHGSSWEAAASQIQQMRDTEKRALFLDMFSRMEFFDSTPREFEMPFFTFDLVVSASCYAQLKRHRMATLLASPYQPELGLTIPEVFTHTGLETRFRDLIMQTEQAYKAIAASQPAAAGYLLTNAHRRRVCVKMNLREIFHFTRLRADSHAQWDIRCLALWISDKVRSFMPLSTMLLCGKSDFTAAYENVFHQKPQHQI